MDNQDEFNPIVVATIIAGTQHENNIPECPPGWVLHRLWTLIDREKLDKMGPIHNQSAFLEDHVHDWRVVNGKLRYYSRVAEIDKPVEVVFQFAPEAKMTHKRRDFSA